MLELHTITTIEKYKTKIFDINLQIDWSNRLGEKNLKTIFSQSRFDTPILCPQLSDSLFFSVKRLCICNIECLNMTKKYFKI